MKRILTVLVLAWVLAPAAASAQEAKLGSVADIEEADVENPHGKLIKRYPFRNSTLIFWQNMSFLTLDKGAEQTWNPSYSWLIRFTPRYYLTDKISLRLKVDLGIEWTNSDETTYYHEAVWEDIWFDVVWAKAYTEKLTGIELTPGVRFTIPASKASQARSLYLGVGPALTFHREWKLPKKMSLGLTYAFRYTKNFNHYTTVQYDAPTIASCAAGGGGDCGEFLHSGARNPSWGLQNILIADWDITKKLHFSQMVAFFNNWAYGLTPTQVSLAGGQTTNFGSSNTGANDVNMRAIVWYLTEIDYDVHRWVTLGIGLSTYNPQLTEDSHYRAPFVNRYSELMLAATFNLDQIVGSIEHRMRSRTFTLAPAQ
jgi:hypothetical protein